MREANNQQGTGAWFNERTGKLTASRMAAAMNYNKNGDESAKRRELKIEIIAERLTGDIVPKYVTNDMKWGIEKEPEAKQAFETATGLIVTDVGFIEHPRIGMCGASPDGFVSDGNAFEVKCPTTSTHLTWLLAGVVPEEHKPQMILQRAVTGRNVWFVSYDPRLPPKQALFYRLFEPTDKEIANVEMHAHRFLTEVEAMFTKITMENE